MEPMDELVHLRSRVGELERIVGELLSHLIHRDAVPPGVPSWCDLSDLLRQLAGNERCDAVHDHSRVWLDATRRAHDRGVDRDEWRDGVTEFHEED